MVQKLRGMVDILPEGEVDSAQFLKILEITQEVAEWFGYNYIETPILEHEKLFKRSVGESSDIVRKEMYRFSDQSGRSIVLRPEGTAGVVRAFISNRLDRRGGKYRFWYFGPMFRYERPQKGRYREFHQFGVEFFGDPSPFADLETIQMGVEILNRLEVEYRLKVNSLGCPKCAPVYRQQLVKFLETHRERLCKDCQDRIEKNPIRTLDCKNRNCQQILEKAPILTDFLCKECTYHFNRLITGLERLNIPYEIDSRLVRGLDYYTRTAFEFIGVGERVGAQNALIGGGRYDRLVEQLGGKETPAVGFAIGVERIIPLVKKQRERKGIYMGTTLEKGVEFLPLLGELLRQVLYGKFKNKKRDGKGEREDKISKTEKRVKEQADREGKGELEKKLLNRLAIDPTGKKREPVVIEFTPKSLKAHLKSADKGGFRGVALLGERELDAILSIVPEIWKQNMDKKEMSKREIGGKESDKILKREIFQILSTLFLKVL